MYSYKLCLENLDGIPLGIQQVIVNSKEEDESSEEPGSRDKVPHVVVVKEVQELTNLIQIPKSEIVK